MLMSYLVSVTEVLVTRVGFCLDLRFSLRFDILLTQFENHQITLIKTYLNDKNI